MRHTEAEIQKWSDREIGTREYPAEFIIDLGEDSDSEDNLFSD